MRYSQLGALGSTQTNPTMNRESPEYSDVTFRSMGSELENYILFIGNIESEYSEMVRHYHHEDS